MRPPFFFFRFSRRLPPWLSSRESSSYAHSGPHRAFGFGINRLNQLGTRTADEKHHVQPLGIPVLDDVDEAHFVCGISHSVVIVNCMISLFLNIALTCALRITYP
jgi:hypothetical protein